MKARIQEVFCSIQGEGPFVGQRQIFIRFSGCDIKCRYCDTPAAARSHVSLTSRGLSRVQMSPNAFTFAEVPDLVTSQQLTELCSRLVLPGPSRPVLSLTGGEPLLYSDFLLEWIPAVSSRFAVYLETNGIQYTAMEKIRELVDVVSMDFKLPSATGLAPFWDEHRKFLKAARAKSLFVKVVVTAETAMDDIVRSADIIAQSDPSIPLVIQPANGALAPEPGLLIDFQSIALSKIGDVRVIPQVHRILSLP